jgi:hypothetical protein
MGRSQRHMLVEQNTTSNGEVHAEGEVAPFILLQVGDAVSPGTSYAPIVLSDEVGIVHEPVGPPGGPLQGSYLSGAIPDSIEPPDPPDPVDETPVLASLEPNTAVKDSPDFTLHCLGSGFTEASVIMFAGQPEPIVFISESDITTGVKPSLGWGTDVGIPVSVKNGDLESASLDFVFTPAEAPPPEEDPEPDPQEGRTFPIGPFPISKLEFTTGLDGIVVLLDENSMFREGDTIRIEATGMAQINGDYVIADIDHRQDGLISFFLPGIDLDVVLQGKGRVTIIDGD